MSRAATLGSRGGAAARERSGRALRWRTARAALRTRLGAMPASTAALAVQALLQASLLPTSSTACCLRLGRGESMRRASSFRACTVPRSERASCARIRAASSPVSSRAARQGSSAVAPA